MKNNVFLQLRKKLLKFANSIQKFIYSSIIVESLHSNQTANFVFSSRAPCSLAPYLYTKEFPAFNYFLIGIHWDFTVEAGQTLRPKSVRITCRTNIHKTCQWDHWENTLNDITQSINSHSIHAVYQFFSESLLKESLNLHNTNCFFMIHCWQHCSVAGISELFILHITRIFTPDGSSSTSSTYVLPYLASLTHFVWLIFSVRNTRPGKVNQYQNLGPCRINRVQNTT